MKTNLRIALLFTLCYFIIIPGLFADGHGKIRGTVVDAETKAPMFGANVLLSGSQLGAATNRKGQFIIHHVPAGVYTVQAIYMGYIKLTVKNIIVTDGCTTFRDFELSKATLEGQEVVITAERPLINNGETNAVLRFSGEDLANIPVRGVSNAVAAMAEVVNSNSNNRGGRDAFNTEEYARIYENDFLNAFEDPLSTFSADVDVAAYANARRYIMEERLPPRDAIRIEECINYFKYDYPQPEKKHPISINLEYGPCPWNEEHQLVNIGLQGKSLSTEEKKTSNLVFLLDVSGSMDSPKKLPLLKKAFKLLVGQLDSNDRIAIVVYAGNSGLVLPSTPGSQKEQIIKALEQLQAGGSTAGGAGLRLAYKVAKENFLKEGNNRVIMATDGDFNVGISSTSELTRFIEEKRDEGIFLTVLGFGMRNYKDNRLEQLADKGNGNHAYIDNILEAKKVLVHEITSVLFTIAKDVKLQVEFNPAEVKSYRLIGYENRRLQNRDFTDDKKDAGEMGAGHTVTALYEIIPGQAEGGSNGDALKYQETGVRKSAQKNNELLNLRIRYKDPDGDKSKEISAILKNKMHSLENTSENFRFSAAVAEYAILLRDSRFKANANMNQVLELAKNAKGDDVFGYRAEFISLVERVEILLEDQQDK